MKKMRIKFRKGEPVKFISHLNLSKVLRQAVRRAGLPIAYSHGFNPHQKISLGYPLPLGMTSESEFADLILTEEVKTKEVKAKLNEKLPPGIKILEVKEVPLHSKSLISLADMASYEIILKQIPVKTKLSHPAIETVSYKDLPEPTLNITVKTRGVKIKDILSSLLGLGEQEVKLLEIRRTEMFARREEGLIPLMEVSNH